jgi:hypothetical protein
VNARADFDGPDYSRTLDHARLTGQLSRVFTLMVDRQWRTLDEIARATGAPAASVSAQLRNLRKQRFGGHAVERRARGNREHGLHEYRLIVRVVEPTEQMALI